MICFTSAPACWKYNLASLLYKKFSFRWSPKCPVSTPQFPPEIFLKNQCQVYLSALLIIYIRAWPLFFSIRQISLAQSRGELRCSNTSKHTIKSKLLSLLYYCHSRYLAPSLMLECPTPAFFLYVYSYNLSKLWIRTVLTNPQSIQNFLWWSNSHKIIFDNTFVYDNGCGSTHDSESNRNFSLFCSIHSDDIFEFLLNTR